MTPLAPFPLSRPRRLRRTPWIRDLVAEHRLSAADLIWPIFVRDGSGLAEPVPSLPGVERLSIDRAVAAAEEAAALGIPCVALFPVHRRRRQEPRGDRGLEPGEPGLPRHPRDQGGGARGRRAARRRARPVQFRRPRRAGARRGRAERRDAARAREDGAGAGRGRLRHPRAVRHDGRADRGDPPGAREPRLPRHRDHELRGQVRVVLLRAVPRRGRLGRGAEGRQEDLPDGPGATPTRRCARWRRTSPRAPTW